MFASKSKGINQLSKFFIVFIMVMLFTSVFSVFVVAKDDDNGKKDSKSDNGKEDSSSNSGSSSSGSTSDEDSDDKDEEDDEDESAEKTETKIITDEQGRKVTIETKTETNGKGETETEEKRTFVDENGNKVTIETKTETNGKGEEKTEIKRKIITLDGREIVIKTKTEIEDGETKTKNSIEVKGVGVETKLSVTEKFEDGQTKLKAKLSTGAEQDIITMPDEALQTALNELRTTNALTFELSEIVEGNVRKAVFSAKATNPGKFLGIFNVNVNLETLVDTQTGEVIKTKRPWWAFLVRGADKINVCHIPEEDPKKRITINIAVPAVKAHLAHGDSVGECVPVCRNGILEEGEICEIGINETQACTTIEGYAGTETCNSLCNGYDACVTTEFCGDNIVNGLEECDDGNTINGDGCSSLCQIEIITNETTPPSTNQTNNTINTTI